MSETISQLPTSNTRPNLRDGVPVTLGYAGPSTGNTYVYGLASVLGANGWVYAGDRTYGVMADGVTDDTNAWNLALTTAATTGAWVVAPLGVSVVSALTVPNGVGILGRTPASAAGVGYPTLGSVIKGTSTNVPTIGLGQFSQLRGLQINGNATQPCVSVANGYAELFDVTLFGGSVGVAHAAVGSLSRLHSCRVHDCTTAGILNPYRTTLDDCIISACGNGIQLGPGCVQVRIANSQIIASTNHGLIADGTGGTLRELIVTGTQIDNSGRTSILLRAVTAATISGNIASRSGQAQGGAPGSSDDAHIYLQNCTGVIVSDNASRCGLNDLGGGYNSPYYAIYDGGGNVNCIVATNILTFHNNNPSNATAGPINVTTTFNLAASLNVTYWS